MLDLGKSNFISCISEWQNVKSCIKAIILLIERLTHYGLMTLYDIRHLGHHLFWEWLVAWLSHYLKQCGLIKSPQSGVTLCFQFVSATNASAAATTFASHFCVCVRKNISLTSKPFELDLRYLAQRIYGSGEMYWVTFLWPWPKVTPVTSISKNLLVCGIKSEPLIGSLQNLAALLP